MERELEDGKLHDGTEENGSFCGADFIAFGGSSACSDREQNLVGDESEGRFDYISCLTDMFRYLYRKVSTGISFYEYQIKMRHPVHKVDNYILSTVLPPFLILGKSNWMIRNERLYRSYARMLSYIHLLIAGQNYDITDRHVRLVLSYSWSPWQLH